MEPCRKEARPRTLYRLDAKPRFSEAIHGSVSPRRSKIFSEERISESMGTRYSAGPPSTRPHSTGVLADECTLDSISSHGMRVMKSPARTSVGHVAKRRRDSFRVSRRPRRLSASACQMRSVPQYIRERTPDSNSRIEPNAREKDHVRNVATRPDLPRSISSPVGQSNVALDSQRASRFGKEDGVHSEVNQQSTPKLTKLIDADVAMEDAEFDCEEMTVQELFKQPETHPITEEQLINEVRGIYTGLVMVEKKCIEIDRQQLESKGELSKAKWQALVSVHRTLLYEHHDFFLASQHPSAGPVLKHLAEKYAMPARMWRYAIHSFLELLRQKLPGSMEYMLDFIYLSYSMMTLLLESVPEFKETWIECLGDLARYRMAVEEFDQKDREIWAGVSRYWYNQDADRSPENGRIQHHLAVLARPDVLQQVFHYTKALMSVRPFANARDSMIQLLAPLMNEPAQEQNLNTLFVAAHGALIMQAPAEEFASRAKIFLSTLRREISHPDQQNQQNQQGQQGAQMISCNIAAIFQYGDKDGVLAREFASKDRTATAEDRISTMQWESGTTPTRTPYTDISSQLAFRASSLAFHTVIVMLGQADPNMYPSVHVSLAFVWCLTLNPAAIQRLEPLVPWTALAGYLNSLFKFETTISKIESESFPLSDDTTAQQLPEDFLIRGQAWSRLYYPEKFFEGAPSEDDRPAIEEASTVIPRRHRCLWLGVRIATFTRWMTYDQTRRFTPTQLAYEYAPIAESTEYLSGHLYPAQPQQTQG